MLVWHKNSSVSRGHIIVEWGIPQINTTTTTSYITLLITHRVTNFHINLKCLEAIEKYESMFMTLSTMTSWLVYHTNFLSNFGVQLHFGLDDTFWLHKKLIHNCHVLTKMDIPKPFWRWDSTTLDEIDDLSRQLCQRRNNKGKVIDHNCFIRPTLKDFFFSSLYFLIAICYTLFLHHDPSEDIVNGKIINGLCKSCVYLMKFVTRNGLIWLIVIYKVFFIMLVTFWPNQDN